MVLTTWRLYHYTRQCGYWIRTHQNRN